MTTFDKPDGIQGWESDSRRIFFKRFGPKVCKKWTVFKSWVSVRVRVIVRVSFSRCEMTTFDEADGVQGWESDSRRIFGKAFGPKVCKKKARVSVRARVKVRVNFLSCVLTTSDEADGVQGWESYSRRIFGKHLGPKVCKKWTVFKS